MMAIWSGCIAVNLVVAAAGGTQLLGYWSLANRLLQVPFWLLQALWRVSYPTMARLRAHGEDTRHTRCGLASRGLGALDPESLSQLGCWRARDVRSADVTPS